MSTSPIAATNVSDLAAAITRQLDTDKDGKLSVSEFEGFLKTFLGSINSSAGAGRNTTPTGAARPVVGTLAGYDATKLANPNHQTTKYQIGRILQHYPNTPAGLRDALPEIQQIAPNARIIGSKGDKIDFGDYVDAEGKRIGVIDVLQAAGLGGTAWQWMPVE